MSRRIVQIACDANARERTLYALDSSGMVWVMSTLTGYHEWKLLPALPQRMLTDEEAAK